MKRNNAKRVLALVLASAMLLQQGSVGIFAAETETVTEAQTEQMTEAKVEETQAPATEAPAPETKAEETQAPATEALAEETKAEETQAPATEATEAPTEETKTEETQTPTTEAPTGETKIEETQAPATEAPGEGTETEETQAPATEAPAETATEAPTEAVTEVPTEKETETESETEEAVVLDTVITQEVFQKTVEDTVQTMVKYTVKVANKAKTADAEDVSVKILLAKALSYSKEDGETAELGVYEKLEDAVNADVFKDIKLGEAVKDAYAEGGVVLWKDQKIAAGEKKEFVFFTAVEDGVTDTEALRNLWFVNDEEITGNGKIEWLNTDLLKVEKELPTEFIYDDGNMVVTATLSDGAILPEGAQFVVTEKTLSEGEAALIEESLGDEQTMTGYVAYDMHFEVDGKEVEPENGTVSVSVSYEKAQALTPVNEGEEAVPEDGEVKMLHITDEQTVEDVTTDVDVKKNGKVREVGFTTEGFSTYVLMSSNEVMPIADDDPEIRVNDVEIGTKHYTNLSKIEATRIFTGASVNNESNRYVVYAGEELHISANVPEEDINGYTFKIDGTDLTTNRADGKVSAIYKANDNTQHTITLVGPNRFQDVFYIQGEYPIYVETALGRRHIDTVHEYLDVAYYGDNPQYLYSPYLSEDSTPIPVYVKNVKQYNHRFVACYGDDINISFAENDAAISVLNDSGAVDEGVKIIERDNTSAKLKVEAHNEFDWNIEVKIGSESLYIQIKSIKQNENSNDTYANHFDIEIADGGTYTVVMKQVNGDGTTKEIRTIYEAYVSGINSCTVTEKDNKITVLESDQYRENGKPGESQYELTSAYRIDKDGNLLDFQTGEPTNSIPAALMTREIQRANIASVVFDLRILLRPSYQITTQNGKSETIAFEYPDSDDYDHSNNVEVNLVLPMGAQEIIDAFNKCPSRGGLDFTINSDLSKVAKFATAQLQAQKLFKNAEGTELGLKPEQFTFGLYDEMPSKETKPFLETTNNTLGEILFNLSYKPDELGKTYVYYIKEIGNGENGIIYDSRVVKATVNVYYVEKENAAYADVTYEYFNDDGTITSTAPTFVNYKSTPEKTEPTPGDKQPVKIGDVITYEVSYKNYREKPATVTVTDTLDIGLTYVNGSAKPDAEYDAETRTLTWTIEDVAASAEGEVSFQATVNDQAKLAWDYNDDEKTGEDDLVLNQAGVKVGDDPKVDTNIVENPVADPHKTEVTPGDRVMVDAGKEIEYKITWKNYKKEAATVVITDALDPGSDYVDKSASDGGEYNKDTHTITWTLENQAAGDSGAVTFKVKVNENAYATWTYDGDEDKLKSGGGKDYEVWNRASVKVGDDPKVNTEIVENPVPEKTEVTPGKGVMTEVGKDIMYEIHWKNGHDEPATVKITDKLDPGVTFKEADNDGTCENGVVTWTLNAAAAGEAGSEGVVKLTVTVNEKAYDTYTYGDSDTPAAGEGKDYEVLNRAGVQVGDDPKVLTNVIPNPVPEKEEVTPGKGVMTEVGKDITYEIHWKNGHDEPATVKITDKLDQGVTFKSADNGGTCKDGVVTWTLDAAAAGEAGSEGVVKLTVTVNEKAYDTYTYGDSDTPAAGEGKDYEVLNRAVVQVDDDPEVLTNIIPNPVPEKDEVTPGKGVMTEVGKDITYEIHWKNGHDESATVTVTDKLDPGVTFKSADNGGTCKDGVVTWTLNAAAAGEAGSVKLTVTVNEKAYDTYTYGDSDTPAAGEGKDYEVLNRAAVQVGHDPKVLTNVIPNPVPEKTEVTPGKGVMVEIGQDITYEIHWKNGHDEPATVTVTDKLDPGVTFKSADNGGTCKDGVVTWTLDAAAAGEAGSEGVVKLTVTVNEKAYDTYTYGNGDTPTAGEGRDYEVLNRAVVQVGHDPEVLTNIIPNPVPEKEEVTPGKGVMTEVGKDITYEIHWKNGHDEPATVTVTDKLDPGVTFKSADNGGTCKDGVVTWTLNAAAGEAGSVKLTVTVNENAYDTWQYGSGDKPTAGDGKDYEVLNRAAVQVGHDPKVLTNVIPNPVPEKTEVTPGKGVMVGIGQDITYEIHWKNSHDEPATVTVTDKLDPGVTFKSADNGGTCKDGVVTWTLNAAAAGEAGSEGSVKLTVTVNENAYKTYTYGSGDTPTAGDGKDYEVLNRAGVQVGHDPKVLTNIIPNPVPEKIETDPGANETVYVGDQITYEIYWKNGHDTAADVTVTDPLDEGLDFVSADQGGSYDSATRTVTWVIKNAAAGQSGKVTLVTKVNVNARKDDYIVENQAGVQVGNDPKVLTQIIPNPTPEEPRDGTIRVTKELTALGEDLYAADETFYVALFADEACTKRVTDIKALEFKNASSSTVTFKNIDIGRTYYVGEVNADGEVILAGLAEDGTIFTANFNEGKSAVVKNADGSTTVVFENTFENIPDGFYRSGKLNITKKLLGVDGKAMDSDETFYAGIFADAEHTELSGDVSENIVELSLGGGSSVSASVDVVCDPEGPTTLYVTEVTEDGRPVGKSFGYTVTVDNGEVSLDVDHTSADVTITNQLKEEPESESEKPTKSVKTGDDTPLMGYVLLMLAALAMAIVAETMRRRRRIER